MHYKMLTQCLSDCMNLPIQLTLPSIFLNQFLNSEAAALIPLFGSSAALNEVMKQWLCRRTMCDSVGDYI